MVRFDYLYGNVTTINCYNNLSLATTTNAGVAKSRLVNAHCALSPSLRCGVGPASSPSAASGGPLTGALPHASRPTRCSSVGSSATSTSEPDDHQLPRDCRYSSLSGSSIETSVGPVASVAPASTAGGRRTNTGDCGNVADDSADVGSLSNDGGGGNFNRRGSGVGGSNAGGGGVDWLVHSIEEACRRALFKQVTTSSLNEYAGEVEPGDRPSAKTEKLPSPIFLRCDAAVSPKSAGSCATIADGVAEGLSAAAAAARKSPDAVLEKPIATAVSPAAAAATNAVGDRRRRSAPCGVVAVAQADALNSVYNVEAAAASAASSSSSSHGSRRSGGSTRLVRTSRGERCKPQSSPRQGGTAVVRARQSNASTPLTNGECINKKKVVRFASAEDVFSASARDKHVSHDEISACREAVLPVKPTNGAVNANEPASAKSFTVCRRGNSRTTSLSLPTRGRYGCSPSQPLRKPHRFERSERRPAELAKNDSAPGVWRDQPQDIGGDVLQCGDCNESFHIYDSVPLSDIETPRTSCHERRRDDSSAHVAKRLVFDDCDALANSLTDSSSIRSNSRAPSQRTSSSSRSSSTGTGSSAHVYESAFEPFGKADPSHVDQSHPLAHYLRWIVERSELLNLNPSVYEWLREVRGHTDMDCLTALQSKSLWKDPILAAILSVGDAQEAISRLQERHDAVQATIGHVTRRLEQGQWVKFCSSLPGLCTEVNDFLREYRGTIESASPYSRSVERHMYETLRRLRGIGSPSNGRREFSGVALGRPDSLVEFEAIQSLMADVKNTLHTLTNSLLLKEITKIVMVLQENRRHRRTALGCLRRAVGALYTLAESSYLMCDLITRVNGVEALLAVCELSELRCVWSTALRALTLLCAQPAATRAVDQCAGVLVIQDILKDRRASELDRIEAVGLLAQLTAPWTETPVLRGMKESMDQLIKSLTEIIVTTDKPDDFLLATAAVANLSFLDRIAVVYLHKYGTTRQLIAACRQKSFAQRLIVKDQIATVLCNVGSERVCHQDVVDCGALTVLLSFLQLRPNAFQQQVDVDYVERIQQKSAIAINRLCSTAAVADRVIRMQGVHRLVALCKHPAERNNADSVLVSCLAALRKIAGVCSPTDMKAIGAEDLISQELWDTFQMYSNKTESYV